MGEGEEQRTGVRGRNSELRAEAFGYAQALLGAGDAARAMRIALDTAGVPRSAWVEADVGVTRAEPFAGRAGLWAPVAGGWPVLTVPVVSGGGTVDIVAFHPDKPHAARLRRGVVDVLGELDSPHERGGATVVRLFADMLGWIAAGGRGAVVLDWKALTPGHLVRLSLVCDDGAHACAVKREIDGVWRRHRIARPELRVAGAKETHHRNTEENEK